MGEYLFRLFSFQCWPLCPSCEEDRLVSLRAKKRKVTLEDYRRGDFGCWGCGWESRGHRHFLPFLATETGSSKRGMIEEQAAEERDDG